MAWVWNLGQVWISIGPTDPDRRTQGRPGCIRGLGWVGLRPLPIPPPQRLYGQVGCRPTCLVAIFAPWLSSVAPAGAAGPKVVGIGVTGVDYVATVDHFPAPDEKMRSTSLAVWTPHPPAPGVGGG